MVTKLLLSTWCVLFLCTPCLISAMEAKMDCAAPAGVDPAGYESDLEGEIDPARAIPRTQTPRHSRDSSPILGFPSSDDESDTTMDADSPEDVARQLAQLTVGEPSAPKRTLISPEQIPAERAVLSPDGELDLSSLRILHLTAGFFEKLASTPLGQNMTCLNVRNNFLKKLPLDRADFSQLQIVDISGNPLVARGALGHLSGLRIILAH